MSKKSLGLKKIMKTFRRHNTRKSNALASKSEELVAPSHVCGGPSILHNLLPVLDLLTILNPKLSYYEDRIVGRPRPQYDRLSSNLPSTLEELWKWSDLNTQPCDCDECAPKLYLESRRSSHRAVCQTRGDPSRCDTHFSHERQSADHAVKITPRLYGDYEAMRLVRDHVAWLDEAYLLMPRKDTYNTIIFKLISQLDSWTPNMTGADLRKTISQAQLLSLFDLLNGVFFRGAVPKHRASLSTGFSWLPESQKNCFGIGSYNAILGTQILLHPTLYRGQHQHSPNDAADLNVRWRNRLGTILHEMCHAYLKAYSCRSCPSHDICMGVTGHGRAWQILAAKIEQVATTVLDGFVDLGRYPSILSEMQKSGKIPSRHDMETYRFGTRWETAPC